MKAFTSLILLLVLVLMWSCNKDKEPEVEEYQIYSRAFTDVRDGTIYKSVKIGEQWWMAENLAYNIVIGSSAYEDDENNIQKYGRLYNLEAARIACPNGWHLPTDEEWIQLAEYIMDDRDEDETFGVNGDISGFMFFSNVGKYLKSKLGWAGAGTDYYGFNGIAGGAYWYLNRYYGIEQDAYWWSGSVYSNPYDFQNLFYWTLDYGSSSLAHKNYLNIDKNDRFSIRCVKD